MEGKTCMTCKWLFEEVCCNADSEHVADYPDENDSCGCWETYERLATQ